MVEFSRSFNSSLQPKRQLRCDSISPDLYKLRNMDQKNSIGVSQVRNSIRSLFTKTECTSAFTFVTIGATSDVVRKKVYPSLWNLYKNGFLPKNIRFFMFVRTSTTRDDIRTKMYTEMKVGSNERNKYEKFWKANHFFVGSYLNRSDYEELNKQLLDIELNNNISNRIFYVAIPSQLETVVQNLKSLCPAKSGWTRVMAEKPFGNEANETTKITQQLLTLCAEDELYRIDEYLGKEVVQNIQIIRFCNLLFSSTWDKDVIESVMITIKDTSGHITKGNNYQYQSIICEVIQPRVLQLLALIAMDKPFSMKPDDISNEKVQLLKCVKPVSLKNVVIGKYGSPDYLMRSLKMPQSKVHGDSDTMKGSYPPTFCTAILEINNARWEGVPFIVNCGKALNEHISEIRIRYHNVPVNIFQCKLNRNELIIQIEPEERVYIKAVTKAEGLHFVSSEISQETIIPLTCQSSTNLSTQHESYENLILNVFKGCQSNFIRTAELRQAWRIFNPLLTKIKKDNIVPIRYTFGSSGPPEAAELIEKYLKWGACKPRECPLDVENSQNCLFIP